VFTTKKKHKRSAPKKEEKFLGGVFATKKKDAREGTDSRVYERFKAGNKSKSLNNRLLWAGTGGVEKTRANRGRTH